MLPGRSALALACVLTSARALAFQTTLGGQPLTVDLTETADVAYHFDNGNVSTPGTPTYDPTSDNYVDWLNRFDAQASWNGFHAELRFDSAVFFNAPSVSGPLPSPFQCLGSVQYQGACENLHLAGLLQNRYVDNFTAEKLSLNWLGEHFDVTVGDFYLSYGRGIVVSLLKVDALGVDTTLRGLNVKVRYGGFSASAAAGVTNVVNTDEATGEVAPDPQDFVTAARLEYRVPRWFTVGVDGAGFFQNPTIATLSSFTPGTPSQPVGLGPLTIGSIQSLPVAPGTPPPSLTDTGNFSATLDLPWLGRWGKLYLEEARQLQTTYTNGCGLYPFCGPQGLHETTNGNAFFASGDLFAGPATVLVEFKDYQNFYYPLSSSLPSTMFPAFWQQNVYTNPPNLEEIFQEEQSTHSTFGPRARVDYQVSERLTPFASFAWFRDATNQYDIWDGYLGADVNWQEHRSHASVSVGRRYEIENQYSGTPGATFQQEWWVQYDAVQVLGPVYSLELEGLHRTFDDDPVLTGHAWLWGYSYLSLKRSAWTATLGFEYNTQYPDQWRPWNPNAAFSWIVSDHYTVRAFAGGREAGLRCVNGICRNFPGFTGASVEIVARY